MNNIIENNETKNDNLTYYQKNKQKRIEYQKQYNKLNKDKIKKKIQNDDSMKEKKREYMAKYYQKIKLENGEQYENYKAKCRIRSQKYRDKKKKEKEELDLEKEKEKKKVMKTRCDKLSPEEKKQRIKNNQLKYYDSLKNDPVKYAEYLQKQRKRNRRHYDKVKKNKLNKQIEIHNENFLDSNSDELIESDSTDNTSIEE